jgi:hypothetical protein
VTKVFMMFLLEMEGETYNGGHSGRYQP